MTPEAAAVKLMWALGQACGRDEAARLFLTPGPVRPGMTSIP